MTKTKTTTHKAEPKKGIHKVLEEIKEELLKLESSSSHGEFRAACRDAIVVIEKHLGHE